MASGRWAFLPVPAEELATAAGARRARSLLRRGRQRSLPRSYSLTPSTTHCAGASGFAAAEADCSGRPPAVDGGPLLQARALPAHRPPSGGVAAADEYEPATISDVAG